MLKDTDDRLLCPECGARLWVSVDEFYSGHAYYNAEANDHINYEAATVAGPTDSNYVELWCLHCKWTTDDVSRYMEEKQC